MVSAIGFGARTALAPIARDWCDWFGCFARPARAQVTNRTRLVCLVWHLYRCWPRPAPSLVSESRFFRALCAPWGAYSISRPLPASACSPPSAPPRPRHLPARIPQRQWRQPPPPSSSSSNITLTSAPQEPAATAPSPIAAEPITTSATPMTCDPCLPDPAALAPAHALTASLPAPPAPNASCNP